MESDMSSWQERTYKLLSNDPVVQGSWEKAIHQALTIAGEDTSQLLPPGGSVGQVLSKVSATDYESTWVDAAAGSFSWMDYVGFFSTAAGTTAAGDVRAYTKQSTTVYRLIPIPYDPAQDAFYSTFSGGVLSNLIITRG
jgi:hypothetical protein